MVRGGNAITRLRAGAPGARPATGIQMQSAARG